MLWLPKWLRSDREPGSTSLVVPGEFDHTRRTFLFLGASAVAAAAMPSWVDEQLTAEQIADVGRILKETYMPWVAEAIQRPSLFGKFVLEDDGKHASLVDVGELPPPMAHETVAKLFPSNRGLDRTALANHRRLAARARETVARLKAEG